MQPVIDFFISLGAWNWFVLAIGLLLLETVIPGVHFMWFGTAAVLIGGFALWVPMPVPVQLIAFALVSMLAILIARRLWRPELIVSDQPDLNVRGHSYVGRVVLVEEPIVNGRGKVRVGDTVWTAEGPDAPSGTKVKVTGVNGTVLLVS